jgi:plastocyanin
MSSMRPAKAIVAAITLILLTMGCSEPAPDGSPAPVATGDPVVIALVARDIAFAPVEFGAPAGVPLRVELDNQDREIPHNIVLYGDAQFTTKLATSEIVSAPATTGMTVPGLVPGVYQFRCDVHPNMTATLTIAG